MVDKDPLSEDLARQIVRQNVEHHDASAPLYDISHPNLTHLYERRLLRQDLATVEQLLGDRQTVRAVDMGAGTGRLALEFTRRGWDTIAVDNSREMLRIAHDKHQRLPEAGRGRLELVYEGAEQFLAGAEGEFDLFGFSSVLHHLPHWLEVVKLCAQRLAPGGCIYITQEPMPADVERKTPAMKVVQVLDEIVRGPQQVYRQVYCAVTGHPKARAGVLVDYHIRDGLDFDAMEAALEARGVDRRRFTRYKDRKTALVAYLDTALFRTPNWFFRYIGQRTR